MSLCSPAPAFSFFLFFLLSWRVRTWKQTESLLFCLYFSPPTDWVNVQFVFERKCNNVMRWKSGKQWGKVCARPWKGSEITPLLDENIVTEETLVKDIDDFTALNSENSEWNEWTMLQWEKNRKCPKCIWHLTPAAQKKKTPLASLALTKVSQAVTMRWYCKVRSAVWFCSAH